jgi:hypothetical protein
MRSTGAASAMNAVMRLCAPQLGHTRGSDSKSRCRQHGPEITRLVAGIGGRRRWRRTDLGRCAGCVRHLTPEGDGSRTQRRVRREHAMVAMAMPPGRRPICEQAAPRDGRSAPVAGTLKNCVFDAPITRSRRYKHDAGTIDTRRFHIVCKPSRDWRNKGRGSR